MIIDNVQLIKVKKMSGNDSRGLVDRYLLGVQMMFSEIDIARASGQDDSISEIVRGITTSSAQIGAVQVMEQANLIENFLQSYSGELSAIHHQSRLDHMIGVLRQHYARYQDEIYDYLEK